MIERLRLLPLIAAAAGALLLAVLGATIAADQAQAEKCNPVCLPPPEEEEVPPPAEGPAPAPSKHRVLVVNVGWGDGSSILDSPLQEGLLPAYVGYINGFVNSWYTQSAPPGAFRGWAAEAGGSYTIPRPQVPNPCDSADDRDDFTSSVIGNTHLKLDQVGVDYEKYPLTVIVYQRSFCFIGLNPGNRVLLSDLGSTIHEFGHVLGLGHANRLQCRDAGGNLVPLSANCEVIANEPFDPMGGGGKEGRSYNRLAFHAAFANHLGWLNDQYFDVRVPATGTFTIKPFIGAGFSGRRAIRLQDGPNTLWIEFRRPIGLDGLEDSPLLEFPDSAGSGVFIRQFSPSIIGPATRLLDMTPGPHNSFSLELGHTWANPLGEATVTLNRSGPEGATITIGTRRTATVPNVIGLDPARAAAVIAGAGLFSRSFTPVIDRTCSYIGLVAAQEPFPGQKAIPGTEVRIQVGEHDPNPETPCQ